MSRSVGLVLSVLLLLVGCGAEEVEGLARSSPLPLPEVEESAYFARLLGPCGELVEVESLGSCCTRVITTENPASGLLPAEKRRLELRLWRIWSPGMAEPLVLFTDPHGAGPPSAPPPLQLLPFGSAEPNVRMAPHCVCGFTPVAGRPYSEEELCYFGLVAERCAPGDGCLLDCWANGAGERIGGGCVHVCFAYSGLPMPELVKGAETCLGKDR